MFTVDTTKIKIQLFFLCCSSSIMLLKVRRKEWLYYFNVVAAFSMCGHGPQKCTVSSFKVYFCVSRTDVTVHVSTHGWRFSSENSCFRLEVLAVTWEKWQDKKLWNVVWRHGQAGFVYTYISSFSSCKNLKLYPKLSARTCQNSLWSLR